MKILPGYIYDHQTPTYLRVYTEAAAEDICERNIATITRNTEMIMNSIEK